MKSKIKLVILTPGFAANEEDSTAIPSLQLYLGNLHKLYPEFNIRILTFHYPKGLSYYKWKDIPVYAAGGAGWKPFKIFLWIKILIHLFRLKKKQGIDIVHAFWLSDTALVGLLFCRLTGVRFLATAMGQDVKKQNNYLHLIRLFNPYIVTISGFQARFLSESLRKKPKAIIPFGVDPSIIHPGPSERNIDILAVGSLNRIKNYPEFIGIISSLSESIPGLKCAIIGEGKEREQIEKLIAGFRLNKTIKLYGSLPYEKVIRKMEESRILLHNSRFEGQGLVLTEALAAGAYVVCYPVGTAGELHHEKLLSGNSPDELKRHICNILNNVNPNHNPFIFSSIKDTCNRYREIYFTLVNGISNYDNAESHNTDAALF
jgi:1,2-diacylglycerol 3-alpha-glucosyltransferase